MKTLKFKNWLNESTGLTREEVEQHLKTMNVREYVINEDMTVDVAGNLIIHEQTFERIPVQFNTVKGWFNCSTNKNLKTLDGAPLTVTGNVGLYTNNSLETLQGCPPLIEGTFYCYDNKILESLQGVSEYIKKDFYCYNNPALKSLMGISRFIGGTVNCYDNRELKFEHTFPALDCIIKGEFQYNRIPCRSYAEYAERFITEENYRMIWAVLQDEYPRYLPFLKKVCYSKGFDLGLDDTPSNRAARQAGILKQQGLDIF